MEISFRIECPKCHWGFEFQNFYINQGYLKGKCNHCRNEFFFKVTVMGFKINVSQKLPKGVPCATLKSHQVDVGAP
jgi:hypothetical protein